MLEAATDSKEWTRVIIEVKLNKSLTDAGVNSRAAPRSIL